MPLEKNVKTSSVQELIPRFYFPQYQPVIDVGTGLIAGFESLIRCVDKQSNTVSASWLFEENIIYDWVQLEIDRRVRKQAIQRFARDTLAGQLFINITPRLLDRKDVLSQRPTSDMIKQLDICPSRLVVEITEAGDDFELLRILVRQYRQAGIKVAINGLGVGSTQIGLLMDLSPDYFILKLSNIRNHVKLGMDSQVTQALSLIRNSKNMEVICEGIETEDDYFFALGCGATKMKGWLFGGETIIFPGKKTYQEQVLKLNKRYYEQRKNKLSRHESARRIWVCWLRLIAQSYKKNRLDDLPVKSLVRVGILRSYLCTIAGKQQGGCINFRPNGYFVDTESANLDRSTRPYFPMTLSLSKMKSGQYLISNIYEDESTKQACITLSLLFNRKIILFVDVLVNENFAQHYDIYRAQLPLKLAKY